MCKLVFTALATLVAAAAAVPAVAQDRAPFTGPRIEGVIGWDQVRAFSKNDDLVYGGGVGYDMQMGGLLVGVDGEITASRDSACAGTGSLADPRLCMRGGHDLYGGARVGGVVGKHMLLYAKGGYTNWRARFTSDDGTALVSSKDNLEGWRVGGGAEFAFNPNMYIKAEYRYSDYNRDINRHQVITGLGVRF